MEDGENVVPNGGDEGDEGEGGLYHLLTDPATLKGGLNLFRQRITNKIDGDEFQGRLDGNYRKGRTLRSTAPSAPPPPAAPSTTKRHKKKPLSDQTAHSSSQKPITRSSSRKPAAAAASATAEETLLEEESFFDEGETKFGKLVNLLPQSAPKIHIEDEFDFRPNQLMESLFPQYEEKQKVYAVHVENVKKLSTEELIKRFKPLRSDLLDIFEGRSSTTRMELYCSPDERDRGRLKSLNVVDPFETQQVMTLASSLINFLLPDQDERLKYGNFIKVVMLPETLMRVYASLNDITVEMAEKEMKWGPRYDGPVSTAK